jgi:homoserine kinase
MFAEAVPSRFEVTFVVVVPDVRVSTQEARRALPARFVLSDAVYNLQRCALFVHALHSGEKTLLREAAKDRLHQEYRAALVPGLPSLLRLEQLPKDLESAVLSVTISGSGSCVLAIVDPEQMGDASPVGAWMRNTLRCHGVESSYRILKLDSDGARVEHL